MADTSARLLHLLSLLQTARDWPGDELAQRLEVTGRTIRRDIQRLRDLGYPVEATMGPIGGYRLVGGGAMPPLLLDDDEAVAIAIGLRTVVGEAIAGIDEASVRALAKLQQVLPPRLRSRVGAIAAATVTVAADRPQIDPEYVSLLARAIANRQRVRFDYPGKDGKDLGRLVEPQRLVPFGRRWYLVAYDSHRDDWRMFRVDRIREPRLINGRVAERELPGGDASAWVARELYDAAPTFRAVVTLRLSAQEAARRLGDATGLEVVDEQICRLRTHADTLGWLASRLTVLGCEFEVHEPPELIDHLRDMASRVMRAVPGAAQSSVPHRISG